MSDASYSMEVRDAGAGRNPPAEIEAATQAAASGRVAEALARLRGMVDGPDGSLAHKAIGDIFARKHLDQQAAEEYERAIKLAPDFAEAHNNLANVLWRKTKDQKALDHYARAIALKPEFEVARENLALIMAEVGDLDEALRLLESAPREQRSATTWRRLAIVQKQAKRLDQALDAAERALELDADEPESLVAAAVVLRARGDLDAALTYARRAVEIGPGSYVGYIETANCLAGAGLDDQALSFARQAVEIAPDNAPCYDILGLMLLRVGRLDEAEHALQHALKVDAHYVKAHFHLGVVFEKKGDYEKAEAANRKVLALRPAYLPAAINLGSVLINSRKPEEAETILRGVLEKEPDSGFAWSVLSRALEELARHSEAAEAAKKGAELAPMLPEAHINDGVARQVIGDLEGARAAFRNALDLSPDFVPAMFSVATTDTSGDSSLLDAVTSRLEGRNLSDVQRSLLLFAQVTLHEARGEHQDAFSAAMRGNDPELSKVRYDYSGQEKLFSSLERVFSASFFKVRKTFGSASKKPIFIVGMPRSGTTLVEQILASHSDVFGAGELTRIPFLAQTIPQFVRTAARYPESCLDLDEPGALGLLPPI